eukprot:9135554-Lingulodinium_polyedra.AAC.1
MGLCGVQVKVDDFEGEAKIEAERCIKAIEESQKVLAQLLQTKKQAQEEKPQEGGKPGAAAKHPYEPVAG